MLRALIESASRFPGLPPDGYESGEIRWVIEIGQDGISASLLPFEKGQLKRMLPTRGDRSGKVSEENLKPALLADRAAYSLGMRLDRTLDGNCLEHLGFRSLVDELARESGEAGLVRTHKFLKHLHKDQVSVPLYAQLACTRGFLGGLQKGHGDRMRAIRDKITARVKPNEMVAFRSGANLFGFELPSAQSFWLRTLEAEYKAADAYCCCCGVFGSVLRILPSQVSLAGYSCPITSFNGTAFNSHGHEQTSNSPICFGCASRATRVLQYLLDHEGHHRAITRDESRGEGKSPLRNQWAVFWLKDDVAIEDGGEPIDVEALMAFPLGASTAGPPATPDQIGRLYGLPFSHNASALHLDQNRFYLAVISPNKSRLVVREWIEESVSRVVESLQRYDAARTIQTDDCADQWRPSIPEMLSSLNPPKSRSSSADANLVRSLLRTAYRGAPPPEKLLEMAVLRFRVPERAKDRREEEELRNRRQTLAAAIKLVLTYGKKEAVTLQTLDREYRTNPHLCGVLLAILEEAQLRASRWRVQATLVDRYYGGASTSPQSTLSVLINQATKAHMPKIRKIGAGYRDLEELLENVMDSILELGGFPPTLTLRQQGDFALGFYHQRASFRAERPVPPPNPTATEASNQEKNNDSL
jgi:CRISPR-associated protein Csd1